jgi:hypothetical protein
MSLESKIEALTVAVVALTAAMQNNQAAPAPQMAATVPAAPPVPQQAAPAAFAPPVQAAPAPAAAMPAPPSFMAPPPAAPAPAGAPFTDSNGLIKYATDAYHTLGEAKGPGLQNIIASLGHQNINDVRPDQYGAFYAAVEALKVS